MKEEKNQVRDSFVDSTKDFLSVNGKKWNEKSWNEVEIEMNGLW